MKICRWFGHKWIPVYIRARSGEYKFVATYCTRCSYGYDELLSFLYDRDCINTYEEKYFNRKEASNVQC